MPSRSVPLLQAKPGRRWAAVAVLLGVLAAHAWLLAGPAARLGGSPGTAAPRAVQVVTTLQPIAPLVPLAAATPAAPATAQAPDPVVAPARTRAPTSTLAPVPAPARSPDLQPPEPRPDAEAAARVTTQPERSSGPAPDNPGDAPEPAGTSGHTPVPVYAAQPPPAFALSYSLLRGAHVAPARLIWDNSGSTYGLTLVVDGAHAGPLRGLGAASRGGFDAAGLAPERFVDRRRGRDARAASFLRDRSEISFSATATSMPLHPGTQDRLSWMLQLAAVLQANPALRQPGARIAMWVAGTAGDARVWDFEVQPTVSRPADDAPGAAAPSGLLHLRRLAPAPYALQVDAWMDPAQHHLPWRVRLTSPPGNWVSDMQRVAPDSARP